MISGRILFRSRSNISRSCSLSKNFTSFELIEFLRLGLEFSPIWISAPVKLGFDPNLNNFLMLENLEFCRILFRSFSYNSTLDCLWTGLVAVAEIGGAVGPRAGNNLEGGLVLLLPKISSISDPPLGKDFEREPFFFSVHFRISSGSDPALGVNTGFLLS